MLLEHRRHSIRIGDHTHISNEGLTLARKVGEDMSEFDLVISSKSTRAIETAIGMGYSVNDTIDFKLAAQNLKFPIKYLPEGSIYQIYQEEFKLNESIGEFGNNLKSLILDKLKSSNAKRVLLITHGGVIESSTVAFFPQFDYSHWNTGAVHCGGVKFEFDNDSFKNLELIEVKS